MAFIAGCASAPARFYTLDTDASLRNDGPALSQPVIVGPVTIPELVDRPQIVTRAANAQSNQIAIAEFARWGESLKSGIADTLAADLGRLLGSRRVASAAQAVPDADAWRVRVDVIRFDSVPGDAVTLDAHWTVRAPNGNVSSGRSTVREAVDSEGYDAIVAAHSRALAQVSREIAAAMRGVAGA